MKPLYLFYGLAFGITWGVGGLGLLISACNPEFAFNPSNPLVYVAGYGPTVAGLIMVGRLEGWSGLRHRLARALPRRAGFPWYLAVVAGFPAVTLAAGRLVAPDILDNFPRWNRLLHLLLLELVTDTGPLGEEFGWRGFALPFLLRRRPPLAAAVILGVVWAFWHLPTFFIPTLSQSRLSIPVFLVNSISLSVIMTWLYRRTGGDLLLMILVHLMANYSAGIIRVPFNAEVGAEVLCAVLIVATGGVRAEVREDDQSASCNMKARGE
jgi:membrane protease YdiL (CAAX protease family)